MESFLGNFYRHFAIFFWSHWWEVRNNSRPPIKLIKSRKGLYVQTLIFSCQGLNSGKRLVVLSWGPARETTTGSSSTFRPLVMTSPLRRRHCHVTRSSSTTRRTRSDTFGIISFLKPGLFLIYFCPFLINDSKWKSADVVLGNRTWGRSMVGADGSTELLCSPARFISWITELLHWNFCCFL